ncbi:hypothetical protein BD31_I1572 [Candidatus Nitrosopumilus salaria BD31]|uniref:Uncharacterized protein n=1 Tax=Candidatus Nitrosopumilus salarius BD31 TaxID=859350 RepID=I3D1K7_9ARCH|nr:hypothetical protein [Candidatus Nitrosopumilus salaria]EIJ65600.1 hypothetical protein BD31_I1572 [Candidatus Nitrosopumilus salaria BD31]
MSSSTSFQNEITEKLSRYFQQVRKEWRITQDATDAFSTDVDVYAPRIDVAVGPFNVSEGNERENITNVFENSAPQNLKKMIESSSLQKNNNPRCMLAIEVVYSGSTKHILGDITNASMIGLYGFVVAHNDRIDEVNRIFEYTKTIKAVHKAPSDLFSNVKIMSTNEFLELL